MLAIYFPRVLSQTASSTPNSAGESEKTISIIEQHWTKNEKTETYVLEIQDDRVLRFRHYPQLTVLDMESQHRRRGACIVREIL